MKRHDELVQALIREARRKNPTDVLGSYTGVPLIGDMLSRLGVNKKIIAYAQSMCRLHMRVHTCYYGKARVSRTNVLFDASVCPEELAWLVVCDARGTGKPRENADEEEAFIMERLEAYREVIARGVPDAKQLMALGMKPGPDMKKALAYAREQVLCGKNAQQAAEEAAERFREKA